MTDSSHDPEGEQPDGVVPPTGSPGQPEHPEHPEHPGHPGQAGQARAGGSASDEPGGTDEYDGIFDDAVPEDAVPDGAVPDDAVPGEVLPGEVVPGGAATASAPGANDYLEDLRRVQAEYVNYKRRVDRDRALAKDAGVQQVVEALIPVLDDLHLAREHGDLAGSPVEKIADKIESALGRFGVTRLGEVGVAFDPAVHEALMHVEAELPEGADTTTVVQVLQPGWKVGERVVRPARVSVADPT